MEKKVKYPIGEQDFKSLREMGCLYVDKTPYIEKMIDSGGKYYFLARPRRFGKSLFLSTLQYFFEGKRDLFKGLYIDSVGWDWIPYPVLRFDLNREKYAASGLLEDVLDKIFRNWETRYGIEVKDTNLSQRFETIIEEAHNKTGQQVVILVDEYDKPLVGNLNIDKNFEEYRDALAALYSNFKSSAEHIRFVFLTGVSRFSKLSVFSALNNINDISFDSEYANVCGITEAELLKYFQPGISLLAEKRKKSKDEILTLLKKNYDGYRFAEEGSDIYNPWSLMCCMAKLRIGNYWSMTGTPTIIAESLKRVDADLKDVLNTECSVDKLMGLDLKSPNPVALLYQTGYLTIKSYDIDSDLVTLGVPNNEVRENLFSFLAPLYVRVKRGTTESILEKINLSIQSGRPHELMDCLQAFFAGITYELKMDNENNFHNAIYILLSLIGVNAKVEDRTSNGRIDMTIETPGYVYIIEFKYDRTAAEALNQINDRQYALKYANDSRKLFKIGVAFSSKRRTLEDYLVE